MAAALVETRQGRDCIRGHCKNICQKQRGYIDFAAFPSFICLPPEAASYSPKEYFRVPARISPH
jgi:hypothetical protein